MKNISKKITYNNEEYETYISDKKKEFDFFIAKNLKERKFYFFSEKNSEIKGEAVPEFLNKKIKEILDVFFKNKKIKKYLFNYTFNNNNLKNPEGYELFLEIYYGKKSEKIKIFEYKPVEKKGTADIKEGLFNISSYSFIIRMLRAYFQEKKINEITKKEVFITGNVPSSKNSKQFTGKRLINSPTVQKYKKNFEFQWEIYSYLFKGENKFPLNISFKFFRDSARAFDYPNAVQLPLDLMKYHGWIEDDNAKIVKPFFEDFEVDKKNPGVLIKLLEEKIKWKKLKIWKRLKL